MKTTKITIFFLVILIFMISCRQEAVKHSRLVKTINSEWTFNYLPESEIDSSVVVSDFDDSQWQAVGISHTWSTYESFSRESKKNERLSCGR